ncbi:hypothetical protein HPB51_014669 [Rhipicephalus microplus]|uniref:CID domain-containing protein n=1 Tax=Rhipicephalus microplus TaxID=6941 RepID=A0A9J6F491_RHIMP|nr:hypothetical protein HPB51_014669 [Rhipicephalus microplus]
MAEDVATAFYRQLSRSLEKLKNHPEKLVLRWERKYRFFWAATAKLVTGTGIFTINGVFSLHSVTKRSADEVTTGATKLAATKDTGCADSMGLEATTPKPVHRLTMLYLANDVLQNGKRKGVQQFIESFSDVLPEHTPLFRDERITKQVDRVFTIWAERSVFSSDFTKSLKEILHESKHSSSHHRSSSKREESSDESGKPKNPEVERIILEFKPEKTIDKIKKIKKVEIETSTKLTNLTSRNMDVSSSEVLRKFKDRTHGQQFQKDFDEATRCLEEYIKALEKEVAERNELIRMLEDAKVYYDSQNGEARIVASAYKNFGNRVKALKKKLEAKTKTLPSPVPSPTPDAPSPTNSDDGLQLPAIQETAEYSTPDAEVEAPLMTDNGAVIDSPCSAPSPGSAPSPEGSPVGLSPVIPGTGGDSGTTSNATGNATALSSFMSQKQLDITIFCSTTLRARENCRQSATSNKQGESIPVSEKTGHEEP